ncbi:MAG: Eco57I restriction-modification methylase [Firmicutes bacterium ADurb.Bin080]|nr:MAG: Eco57I restriction-modification methylase [Firmicutes bacterium ADurb.Bin080]
MIIERENEALLAQNKLLSSVEEAYNYIEKFDILETINNVGNDEIFTPVKLCNEILDVLPAEVWSNPKYKWLNPCDKNGVFSREIALRLDEGLKTAIPNQEARRRHIMKNMLFSLGLTKFTALVARRTLYYCSVANRKFTKEEEGYAIGNGTWFDDNEGNIKTPITEHSFDKKGRCIYCGTSKQGKYTDPKQIEHYAYEFLHNDNIEEHLQKRFFKGNKNMKFDIIIGNPPYHLSDGGFGASAMAIYDKFVLKAISLEPKYLSMIIPTRWISDGKGGVNEFRKHMLQERRLVEMHDYEDAHTCFPSVSDIKGGVCYFLWDRDHNSECNIYNYDKNGDIFQKSYRFLLEKSVKTDIVLRDSRWTEIVIKVQSLSEESFIKFVSPRKPYGLSGDVFDFIEKYHLPKMSEKIIKDGYKILGRSNNKPAERYVDKGYPISKNRDSVEMWKIFTQRNVGTGKTGDYLPKIIIAEPGVLCTETYLMIGPFPSKEITNNVATYIKTKFFRLLVEMKKNTQGVKRDKFSFVPIQDFNKPWTDKELYEKYKLSQEEIDYIEKHIKEMD